MVTQTRPGLGYRNQGGRFQGSPPQGWPLPGERAAAQSRMLEFVMNSNMRDWAAAGSKKQLVHHAKIITEKSIAPEFQSLRQRPAAGAGGGSIC